MDITKFDTLKAYLIALKTREERKAEGLRKQICHEKVLLQTSTGKRKQQESINRRIFNFEITRMGVLKKINDYKCQIEAES